MEVHIPRTEAIKNEKKDPAVVISRLAVNLGVTGVLVVLPADLEVGYSIYNTINFVLFYLLRVA